MGRPGTTWVAVAGLLIFAGVGVDEASADPIAVASWNIRNLGWDNGKDYDAVAAVAEYFDLIAVQEVMNDEGIETLHAHLEARTGQDWAVVSSHHIGRGSYQEMYSFLWREAAVDYTGESVVYLDDRDVFAREPVAARFEAVESDLTFTMGNIHAIYGDSVDRREAEARALRAYWDWLGDVYPDDLVIIAGDFNLPPTNPAWAPMREVAAPSVIKGATTISTIDGRFANLYDNLWVPVDRELPIAGFGSLEFPHGVLGIDHETARDRVSDHIPVWAILDSTAAPLVMAAGPAASTSSTARPPVIGNRNSGIFHWPGCPGYDATAEQNVIGFADSSEAEAAGFRAARNC